MSRKVSYIGAGVLFLISLCFLGYGGMMIIGATAENGDSSWVGTGIIFLFIGLILVGGGIFLVRAGLRTQPAAQNVTMKVELPGSVSLDSLKCQACGGALTEKDIKMVNGAPMVTCPYCGSVYQLTEEPKW
jgi:hypothetical protein